MQRRIHGSLVSGTTLSELTRTPAAVHLRRMWPAWMLHDRLTILPSGEANAVPAFDPYVHYCAGGVHRVAVPGVRRCVGAPLGCRRTGANCPGHANRRTWGG